MFKNKIIFKCLQIIDILFIQVLLKSYIRLKGTQIDHSSTICKFTINWPHQLSIGRNCRLESGIIFKYDSICKPGPNIVIGDNVFIGNRCEFNITEKISIGSNSLISAGCKFIDHDHGVTEIDVNIRNQDIKSEGILIEENVWIGANCVILKGVRIANGSVVGAGSVVTKSIASNEIWGGVPSKLIKYRKQSK